MTAEDDVGGGAAGTRVTGGEGMLFDLLKDDHREVLRLFDELERCATPEMETLLSLFNRIEEELQRHLEGEERFLYTALERHEGIRDIVLENYDLDRLATHSIGMFKALALDDERWKPKARVLRRLVEAHVDLQEARLFPGAARVLDREQMGVIAGRFLEIRNGAGRRAGLDAPR